MINEIKKFLNANDTMSADELYTLYLQAKIAESEKNLRDGNVITLQELKKYIDKLEEKYDSDTL